LNDALNALPAPDKAIVCTGVEDLASITSMLMKAGTRFILSEKPGGLNSKQLKTLLHLSYETKTKVLVAYNRRFYASVRKGREIIEEDGGILSCHFEFTEWSHKIIDLVKGPGVKEAWMTANSSHVSDLAFHLAGSPEEWHSWTGGQLSWHSAAARFCGAGKTSKGAFFNYFADWEAPGRWGVEFMTRNHRLIFRPMEELNVTRLGSVTIEKIEIDDSLDKKFKPGLYMQTKAFLDSHLEDFCTLEQQVDMCRVYEKMAGYDL
jgi:predicted dehydrogenase